MLDLASRKDMAITEIERWPAPILSYEPKNSRRASNETQ